MADAETWVERELPGQLQWEFGEVQALQIAQPTLSVLGAASEALWARFGETHRLLLEWIPRSEGFLLSGATHFLHLEHASLSRAMAAALARFFAGHSIGA